MQAVAPIAVVNVTALWQPTSEYSSTLTLSIAQNATLTRVGVSVARLAAATECEMQIVLMPFGAEKAELEDYQVQWSVLEPDTVSDSPDMYYVHFVWLNLCVSVSPASTTSNHLS